MNAACVARFLVGGGEGGEGVGGGEGDVVV